MVRWCEPVSTQGQDLLGATAVQIAVKEDGVRRIVEHLGSAHSKTELAALLEVGRQRIAVWLPPGHHRNQHQARHTRPQTPPRRHHQPQRPPPHRRRPPAPPSRRHPHRPEHPTPGTLTVMSQV